MAYGLKPLRKVDGSPFTGALSVAYLDEASQAYFKGDLLALSNSTSSETAHAVGELTIGSATDGATAMGVAQYFEWTGTDGSFNQANTVPAAAVAATGAANRVKVYYIPTTHDIIWSICADDDTDALTSVDIGSNFDLAIGAGNATTGLSGHVLDSNTEATTAATPLRLLGLVDKPGNTWGNTAGTVEVEVIVISNAYNSSGSTGITT